MLTIIPETDFHCQQELCIDSITIRSLPMYYLLERGTWREFSSIPWTTIFHRLQRCIVQGGFQIVSIKNNRLYLLSMEDGIPFVVCFWKIGNTTNVVEIQKQVVYHHFHYTLAFLRYASLIFQGLETEEKEDAMNSPLQEQQEHHHHHHHHHHPGGEKDKEHVDMDPVQLLEKILQPPSEKKTQHNCNEQQKLVVDRDELDILKITASLMNNETSKQAGCELLCIVTDPNKVMPNVSVWASRMLLLLVNDDEEENEMVVTTKNKDTNNDNDDDNNHSNTPCTISEIFFHHALQQTLQSPPQQQHSEDATPSYTFQDNMRYLGLTALMNAIQVVANHHHHQQQRNNDHTARNWNNRCTDVDTENILSIFLKRAKEKFQMDIIQILADISTGHPRCGYLATKIRTCLCRSINGDSSSFSSWSYNPDGTMMYGRDV